MANYPTEWRIKAPNAQRKLWSVVVTTSDELGRISHIAHGKTYDEAVRAIRERVEQRQLERLNHAARFLEEHVIDEDPSPDDPIRGQLSASNSGSDGGQV